MSNVLIAIVVSVVILSVTLLVALGKIEPAYLAAIVSSIVAWLIPSPIKRDPS